MELCFKKGLNIFENESNKFYDSYEKFIRKIELSRKMSFDT